MRVALILSEDATEATVVRALTIARSLRDQAHEAVRLAPRIEGEDPTIEFVQRWQAEGFSCVPVNAAALEAPSRRFPKDPSFATACAVASVVKAFDVAWFFESEWAIATLRERRFADRQLPVVVLDALLPADPIPDSLEEINKAFARSYALRWADLILRDEPSDAESDVRKSDVRRVEELWMQYANAPIAAIRRPTSSPGVTVCIPYFEAHDFLGATLRSLEMQSAAEFTVIVVDDGSLSEEAQRVFDKFSERYSARGWRFLRQENRSAGAARNRAAREATTEFLLFLDADDIAMPTMVERFLRAALLTGDDFLVAPNYGFLDDPEGPCEVLYDPPGNSLVGSMGDDMHGGSCILARRESFERLGGFTEIRGVGFEDYEFHVRANLEGMRWDVLPELIYRYRMPRAGGVSQSTAAYANLARVLRWYEESLRPAGLEKLPLAFASAYWKKEREDEEAAGIRKALSRRLPKRSPHGRELKLLLLTCNFPFGIVSGWHTRVQQMIRYFGSRYELTLMTSMPREQLAPVRKETFRHLHAVLGVEGSDRSAIEDVEVPFRVREHYTDVFQDAIRRLPTEQFHAAILDQLFMAEFRKDVHTLPVLTEHNIESRLLRQASERVWSDEADDALPLHYRNALIEAGRVQRYEDEVWPQFPLRAVVSDIDRDELNRRSPKGKTVVAPNGADISNWIQGARFEAATVLFAGHLAYLPNVDAVEFLLRDIWPTVRRLRPKARLILAGRDPSDGVRAALQRAGGVRAGIELCASPLSMDAVAGRASISVAPLRLGSGTRCKILDSMAWGLPVVSTTLGAEGLAAFDEEQVLLRDDPAEFAEGIIRLLSDEVLWSKLRNAGGALVRERYSWDRVFTPLEDALLELIP